MKDTAAGRSSSLAVLCISLIWTATAIAGLKDTPPKNFDAASSGAWQMDPARSDDPEPILDKAREKMAAARGSSGRQNRGDMGGGGGGGPWGGGGGGRRGGGGGHRGQAGGPSPDGSPPGAQVGGANTSGQLLDDLAHNPSTLKFERSDQRVKVFTGEFSASCRAGPVATFSDSMGSGEHRCGWSGSAWVVETSRGNNFTRTDRYEPARDGKTLSYVTTVKSGRLATMTISRTYMRSGK